jgi:histidinol dehydrogenase
MKNLVSITVAGSSQGRALLKRIESARAQRKGSVEKVVEKIIADIAKKGDRALFAYTKKYDGYAVTARTVRISRAHIQSRAKKVSPKLKTTIRQAAKRIRAYHARQMPEAFRMKSPEGILSQRIVPLTRVGVYVPGGYTAYPSSVLMNVIPAQVAGVKEIAVVTPARGALDPHIAFALMLLGIEEVYRVGGSQAVAALAFGTKTISPVDKIVGPGNAYVAAAKRLVYGMVDIDSIAGPSEVAIVADTSANPRWIALDMLAQAEHGSGDETAVCITESMTLAKRLSLWLEKEIAASPIRKVFQRLKPHALAVLVTKSRTQSIELVNRLAPEHLQIMTRSAKKDVQNVVNSGAIFLGNNAPVALGDYFVGTNHVLPTGASARFASGLGTADFIKRISLADISKSGLIKAAAHVSRFARAEKFIHHALSVERRAGMKI